MLNKERIKKLYTLIFSKFHFLVDIYFSLGIKPWLGLILIVFSGSEKQYVDSYLNFYEKNEKDLFLEHIVED